MQKAVKRRHTKVYRETVFYRSYPYSEYPPSAAAFRARLRRDTNSSLRPIPKSISSIKAKSSTLTAGLREESAMREKAFLARRFPPPSIRKFFTMSRPQLVAIERYYYG